MMGMSQLEPFSPETSGVTSGSPGSETVRRRPSVDLNEEPTKRLAGLVGVAISDESKEDLLESLRQRCQALRNTGRFSMNITSVNFCYNSFYFLGYVLPLYRVSLDLHFLKWNNLFRNPTIACFVSHK